ncbi:NACHT domain-containing protein [Nonomuraea sp. bgisy094]|uniref:NACHT domain-containing protein n=1 Tax=Nonomuraea sp. bgisy094 TaxID=3413781 RepID=UPI003EBBD6A8
MISAQFRILPEFAIARYEDNYRRLAIEVPEFAFWTSMVDHQSTRKGLANLERLLSRSGTGCALPEQLDAIKKIHRSALNHQVVEAGDVPTGMRLPMLEEAYIAQRFRVAEMAAADNPSVESCWEDKEVREDLETFLAGFLTHPTASRIPLIVLGQPGAGKSALSKVLGARLSDDYLPIRVPLREVSANAGIQEQIEQAIVNATGERLSWPALVRAAQGILPVVILDGFDELLQATGLRESDYLTRVVRFQEQQAELGRAVAVVVTSRTAVAHYAKLPQGALVARLEPFDEGQISRWLEVWNRSSATYFAEFELETFALDLALKHRGLSEQPLLLLMLALYDADGNSLRLTEAKFGQADLYERLVVRFVERETEKLYPSHEVRDQVELELQRLAFVAFSMFNRRRQWITGEEVNGDLCALGSASSRGASLATPLSAGEQLFGRFFFVYEARATRDADVLQTYEFLHATFGDFLIARLVTSILSEMASRPRSRLLDDLGDCLLRSLLSWSALALHSPLVSFFRMLAIKRGEASQWLRLALELFRDLDVRADASYPTYRPAIASPAKRYAYYSMNLILLAAASTEYVVASDLLPGHEDVPTEWERYFFLWKSQCAVDEFESHIRMVQIRRRKTGNGWGYALQLDSKISAEPQSTNNHSACEVQILDVDAKYLLRPSGGLVEEPVERLRPQTDLDSHG